MVAGVVDEGDHFGGFCSRVRVQETARCVLAASCNGISRADLEARSCLREPHVIAVFHHLLQVRRALESSLLTVAVRIL